MPLASDTCSCSAKAASLIIGKSTRFTTKPGRVLHVDRQLAELLGEVAHRRERAVGGAQPAHHLDQLHRRHRVEEVHADEVAGAAHQRGQPRDRQARGVGGDDAVLADDLVEPLEDLALDLEILGRRLEHDVAALQLLERHDAADALHHASACASVSLFFATSFSTDLRMRSRPLATESSLRFWKITSQRACGRHLRDPAAHRSRTDHADGPHGSDELHAQGDGFAATDAECGDALAKPAILQRVQQRHQHARARAADRVAERRGAAVHVDAVERRCRAPSPPPS